MTYPPAEPPTEGTLDPDDWAGLRAQGHRMLDDMFDYLATLRERPVWQPAPAELRAAFRAPLPRAPSSLEAAHNRFMREILPYAVGNAHPGFMGWVHGGGTAVGMLAETLAAGLNANLGGRNQVPVEVERQITRWMRELFGFPDAASGLFVTGTSMANLIGVLVARAAALGRPVRRAGVAAEPTRLTAYTSACAHTCVAQAMDISGLGSDALRLIPVDDDFRMDVDALRAAIAADRRAGLRPFLIAGTAGTVDVGAVDPLDTLADIAADEGLWFHVDGAFGALAMLSPELAPLLAGIERADSIAFDFHKWGQVPYDAGFILVRDGETHRAAFDASAAYLSRETRGMAADSPWPCDYGPDLSRGFRALKTWFTLTVYGADRLGAAIARTCAIARHLARRVQAEPALELLAPVALNIVCFRYRGTGDAAADDRLNAAILLAVQESGLAAPSSTRVRGSLAIRAAIVNHRTAPVDVDRLCDAVLRTGAALAATAALEPHPIP
ncbi:pyridoxal phosphate-dependent decarboxylase family protein [Bordetella bronchialis]|uniref:Cytochrome D ubiquinol oxidase subunit I n=1 Tax=Bordetella bronchialis TaxID=463025 RepID=A0ABN4R0W2_9BORD|nr:pyridoxal-dependent decarboxylase [Bordetella bronchialis]ANN66084.1 cytochrome D ubiquinol oxidase subunit I [Bordetella bronchialis]